MRDFLSAVYTLVILYFIFIGIVLVMLTFGVGVFFFPVLFTILGVISAVGFRVFFVPKEKSIELKALLFADLSLCVAPVFSLVYMLSDSGFTDFFTDPWAIIIEIGLVIVIIHRTLSFKV